MISTTLILLADMSVDFPIVLSQIIAGLHLVHEARPSTAPTRRKLVPTLKVPTHLERYRARIPRGTRGCGAHSAGGPATPPADGAGDPAAERANAWYSPK